MISPIQRELDETKRELNEVKEIKEEMRKEITQLEELKNSIIDTVKLELDYKIGEVEEVKTNLVNIEKLKVELIKVINENEKLKEQQKKQERHNRRSNVIMKGFEEHSYETTADCKKLVITMLQQSGINLSPMAIEVAQRVGAKQRQGGNKYRIGNRPILVRFLHMGDRDNIMLRKEQINTKCRILVEDDYPPEIETRRKELYPIMRAINNHWISGQPKYRATLWEDRLIV